MLLDFVNSLDDGRKTAETFSQCYSEALRMGFTLEHDYFVNQTGRRVHVTEAIGSAIHTVYRFRRALRTATTLRLSRQ